MMGNQYQTSTAVPNWVLQPGGIVASEDIDFANNRAWNGSSPVTPSSQITVSRASTGTASDSSGNWSSFTNNVGRITNQGLLVEEARTNSIRNNTMVGAVVGTIGSGGVLPTNWQFDSGAVIRSIIGTGTINGINYVDIRWQATANSDGNYNNLFENSTSISALQGQTWSGSIFLAIVSGSITNISGIFPTISQRNSSGTTLSTDLGSDIKGTLTSTLQRFLFTETLGNNLTAFTCSGVRLGFGSNNTIDITLRIGWPQLENNSLINSTVASAAIAAAGSGGVSGSAVYQVSGGTGTPATLNVTVAGGITVINSVASAGSYTVFPPSPAALTYVSGTGSGVTGATVNLTPTNNAALGFATSPILTTNAAATRAADVVTVTSPPVFGSAYTLFIAGTPAAPLSYPANQNAIQTDTGSTAQRYVLRRNINTSLTASLVGGVGGANPVVSGAWAQAAFGKLAAAAVAGAQSAVFDGGTVANGTIVTLPTTPTNVSIGTNVGGVEFFNGVISRFAIWSTTALSSITLQAITT